MKRQIIKAATEYTDYSVSVTFASYVGVSEEYEVYAENEDEAIDQAIADAAYKLDVEYFEPVK